MADRLKDKIALVTGAGSVWVGVGCCTGIAFSWFVVARRLRVETARVGALTLADYFSARFPGGGHPLRITATVIIFTGTFYALSRSYVGSTFVAPIEAAAPIIDEPASLIAIIDIAPPAAAAPVP